MEKRKPEVGSKESVIEEGIFKVLPSKLNHSNLKLPEGLKLKVKLRLRHKIKPSSSSHNLISHLLFVIVFALALNFLPLISAGSVAPQRQQDVADNQQPKPATSGAEEQGEQSGSSSGAWLPPATTRQPEVGSSPPLAGSKLKNSHSSDNNNDFLLDSLPVFSVAQKQTARFECELNPVEPAAAKPLDSFKLIWLKLSRRNELNDRQHDDIVVIGLNQKLIAPDKRFKIRRQSSLKWTLSLENVQPEDGEAFYLCQLASATSGARNRAPSGESQRQAHNLDGAVFIGGGRLNVLVPPKIVEEETSGSLVLANEFEPLVLRCKVRGEPQSQIMWKREEPTGSGRHDITSLGGEQRFKHEVQRNSHPNQLVSIDSSELVFDPFSRQQAGAYLCIASNGVLSGVSQRINVAAANCRKAPGGPIEAATCDDSGSQAADLSPSRDTTTTTTPSDPLATTTTRRVWQRTKLEQQQQRSRQQFSSSDSSGKRKSLGGGLQQQRNGESAANLRPASGNGAQTKSISSAAAATDQRTGFGLRIGAPLAAICFLHRVYFAHQFLLLRAEHH